ncbi:MAG: hypothetical protein WC528_03725 [Patescibacteria group bacterium]
MSGHFGMFNGDKQLKSERLVSLCRLGATSIQHRGPGWTGVSYTNGDRVWADDKAPKKVEDFMTESLMKKILSDEPVALAIHVQQSLKGMRGKIDAQHHYVRGAHGTWSLSTDGAIPRVDELREQLKREKVPFYGHSTAEFLLLSILHIYESGSSDLIKAMTQVMNKTVGVFSACLMTGEAAYLFRDRFAGQPFWLARFGSVYVWASESCAIDQMRWVLGEPELFRVIRPGEIIRIDCRDNFDSIQAVEPSRPLKRCIFNPVYTARPDSLIENYEIVDWQSRMALIKEGRVSTIGTHRMRAAQFSFGQRELPENSIIISVPASGDFYQDGLSQASGLAMHHGIVRNPYVGRTFLGPFQEAREEMALLKFNPLPDLFVGHPNVVVTDDSIVRGTNFKKICWMLRHCGAKNIQLRIGSPPYIGVCHYGGDTRTEEELFANQCRGEDAQVDIVRLAKEIGADSVEYLTLENLKKCIGLISNPDDYCYSCFDCQRWHEEV